MKKTNSFITNSLAVIILFLISFSLTSCEAIEGIFKAGMGVGIFIAVAMVVIIIVVIAKLAKK